MNSVARARALGASCLSFFSQRKGLVHVPWSKMGSPYKWYGNSCEKCSCRFITYHYALMRYDSILYIYTRFDICEISYIARGMGLGPYNQVVILIPVTKPPRMTCIQSNTLQMVVSSRFTGGCFTKKRKHHQLRRPWNEWHMITPGGIPWIICFGS